MKHYQPADFAKSTTAKRRNIDNSIIPAHIPHIQELIETLLDPLTDAWGSKILVTSGYRCQKLNEAVGGSKTSAHSLAYAADLVPANGKIEEFKAFTMKWLYENKLVFDQYINEYSGKSSWVHLAVRNRAGNQRKQFMLYKGGKYSSINPVTFKGGATVGNVPSYTQTQGNYAQNGLGYTDNSNNQTYDSNVPQYSSEYGDNLEGQSVYLNEIDIEAIKNNEVFTKGEDGEPLVDPETGEFVISDEYLFEKVDEEDLIENIEDIPAEPDDTLINVMTFIENTDQVEMVKGIAFSEDGSYKVKHSKSVKELLCQFQQWNDLVDTLRRTVDDCDQNKPNTQIKQEWINEVESIKTINTELVIHSAFDKFGHAIRHGQTCPVCGKRVKFLQPGGFCSYECVLKYAATNLVSFLLQPNDYYKDFQDDINRVIAVLDFISLVLNALMGLPNLLKDMATLPPKYKNYVMMQINVGFCFLQECITKLMIKKNKLLLKILSPIKMGFIAKPLAAIGGAIDAINTAIAAAVEAFNYGYDIAMNALNSLAFGPGGLCIKAESFAVALSPRSFISPMPYTCPDAGKIFIDLPGALSMGTGAMKLALPGALTSTFLQVIDVIVDSCFPPLTPLDYYLEPELFIVRYTFSDQSKLTMQIRQQLEDIMKIGPDYIPKFENLFPIKMFTIAGKKVPLPNIGYIWFLLGLMDSWGPHSQALVGSILNPAI